jgi:hypothetical protein
VPDYKGTVVPLHGTVVPLGRVMPAMYLLLTGRTDSSQPENLAVPAMIATNLL